MITPSRSPILHAYLPRALVLAGLLGACASQPPPEPVAAPQILECLPPLAVEPAPPAPMASVPPPQEVRGYLQPGSWEGLPEWGREDLGPALAAFLQSCSALRVQDAWKAVCEKAERLAPSPAALRSFFETEFLPHQVINADGGDTGMVTGYYEPLLRGSRTPTPRFRYPLYAPPDDLLVVDLSSVYPDLKHKRLRGRLEGNRIVPYYSRAQIEANEPPLKGRELVWVDDPVDLFFLHIQGSGQVLLPNGESMRVGYADQNGHPFRSVGRLLIERRELPPERVSMQGIKNWARRHPKKLDEFLNANPSYVFFRELPAELTGPLGTLGVPLTAERSIAVDPRVVPLGVPVYLSTTWPNSPKPLNRLMLAQDTGGAIAGAVRADFYWGFGDGAGKLAGSMKQSGRMWVLLPRGVTPTQ